MIDRIHTPARSLVCTMLAAVSVGGCAAPADSPLTVTGGAPVRYRCTDNEAVVARYYTLSDESLRFVKLALPGNRAYTLPQAVSGSGARYTDERELVWWSKGDGASVQRRDADGKWGPVLECSVQRD